MGYRYRQEAFPGDVESPGRALRLALLGRVGFGGRIALRERTPGDAGLFGPESQTWRIMGDPVVNITTSILQQLGPPPIAQALLDRDGARDLFARVLVTQAWTETVVFGTSREAKRACHGMLHGHRSIGSGTVPAGHETAAFPAGTPYDVADPLHFAWVLGSIIDHASAAYKRFRGPLSSRDEAAYVREWHIVLQLLEIPPGMWWADHRQLRAFLRHGLSSWAVPGPGARLFANSILTGGFSTPLLRLLWRVLLMPTIALTDETVRAAYGLRVSGPERAAFRAGAVSLRVLGRCGLLPASKGVKRFAETRAAGALPGRSARCPRREGPGLAGDGGAYPGWATAARRPGSPRPKPRRTGP